MGESLGKPLPTAVGGVAQADPPACTGINLSHFGLGSKSDARGRDAALDA